VLLTPHDPLHPSRPLRCATSALVAILFATTPVHAALTEAPRLAAIYDTILEARFDDAAQQLARACPPAPPEACQALQVVLTWWTIVLDPNSRHLDARLLKVAADSIARASAWTRREPDRAEAWFYLAGSYAPLVQWRVLRGERLAAAREGSRIKTALERALALDPTLQDAYFGIGLYHYYADVVPAAARLFRWLLLLPGGDRAKGLREMLQARERGALLRGEADYQLHWLYLWYERQPERALDLLAGLDERYPSNPVFLQRIAEVRSEYLSDHPASAEAWQMLLGRAREGRVNFAPLAEVRARLGLASELLETSQTERAIDHLNAVLALKPTEPYSAHAIAHVQLGNAYDRIGKRDLAVAAYTSALALAPSFDPANVRRRARAGLQRKF
jgi:tetratricopeptide (TPR) repeat protein